MDEDIAEILDQFDFDYEPERVVEAELDNSGPTPEINVIEGIHPEKVRHESTRTNRTVANTGEEIFQINREKTVQCPFCDSVSRSETWTCDSCGHYICDECGKHDKTHRRLCPDCFE